MTIQPTSVGKRIVFLDSLRAIAVLLVLWGHVFLVGINDPTTVGVWVPDVTGLAFGPTTVADNIHGQIGLWAAVNLGIGAGGVGVSLFFIISGFVILRTIDRTSPIPFMIQRVFRIVPVCFFCVTLVAAITYAYCESRGLIQPNSINSILTSSIAANYFNGAFSTIPVLWTLEIEMLFYVVMAVGTALFRRLGYKELAIISLLCLAFVAAYGLPAGTVKTKSDMFRHFSSIFVHISYMMIGAFIYRAYSSAEWVKGVLAVSVSIALYVASYKIYGLATGFMGIGADLPSTTAGLLIFLVGMAVGLQGKIFAPLRWVASISYPLYLLHIPLAWGALYALAAMGFGMYCCAMLASIAVVILSWATHRAVELPSQALGKKLSKLLIAPEIKAEERVA